MAYIFLPQEKHLSMKIDGTCKVGTAVNTVYMVWAWKTGEQDVYFIHLIIQELE